MQRIRCLVVVTQNRTREFVVGKETLGRKIASIINSGTEYEDHVFSQYDVLDEDGDLITTIENCPVVVDWEKEKDPQ